MKHALPFLFVVLAACAEPAVQMNGSAAPDAIYWSDGDSGRIDGMKFRLADVDAPETGGVGARGGAKCEFERALGYDAKAGRVQVQPGLVLDDLNRRLKADGWWYPVDVSTASRATLGGMAANNSCGSRSIRYGKMQDNVLGMEAMLQSGELRRFGAADPDQALDADMLALATRERAEIEQRFPAVQRRVGGYNIDALLGKAPDMAQLLIGSEGTLAITKSLDLKLSPVLQTKTLGVCHFPTFHAAMDAAQHIVKLGPVAVELVDHNMIRLGRDQKFIKFLFDKL